MVARSALTKKCFLKSPKKSFDGLGATNTVYNTVAELRPFFTAFGISSPNISTIIFSQFLNREKIIILQKCIKDQYQPK